jgi:amidase
VSDASKPRRGHQPGKAGTNYRDAHAAIMPCQGGSMTDPSAAPTALSSAEQVDHLLNRIGEVDGPVLHAVIATNADAMATAIERDAESRDGRGRSPLHGVPVLVKDNVDTADMETTAGSLALLGHRPAVDAPIVARLRDAGLVVLGKTNLSEWANIRSPHSTSGWSAVGGLTGNPWGAGRSAGGSSSGSGAAVAAGLAALAVGPETDGSIVCPASLNGVVGVKPTVGLLPSRGIVPISTSQDTAGPLARSVAQAAALLDVLAGTAQRYTNVCAAPDAAAALRGTRIGVARAYFGAHPATDATAEEVLGLLAAAGATLVDPANVPTLPSYDTGDDELTVLLHELARDLEAYLATRPEGSPRTLADVVAFNRANAETELPWFGQEFFEQALTAAIRDPAAYAQARQRGLRAARDEGIDKVLLQHQLDALIAPAYGPAWLSDLVNGDQVAGGSVTAAPAVAGYPLVSVPMGLVHGLPVGLAITGTAGSEATLLRIARGVEHAVGLLDAGALVPPGW